MGGGVDIHVISIIITDDFYRCVALIAQIFAAPLGETIAGHTVSITVRGKNRLAHTRSRQVVREDAVHDAADILINISAVNPLLVVGGGGRDREVVALVPVLRKRHLLRVIAA